MPTVEPWNKRILAFQPSSLVPLEQCERHYLRVHSPWAVREIRRMDDIVSYHTNLMLGQWDLLGGFHQAPDQWRFATMRSRPGGHAGFPPPMLGFLSQDHESFLSHLRGFAVEESVWLDRRSGQLTSEKYVIVLDRPDGLGQAAAHEAAEVVQDRLRELLEDAYGARLMVVNRVLAESQYDEGREPGQRITSRSASDSSRVSYLEIYFDHQEWGEEFFARADVQDSVRSSPFAPGWVAGYHVLERAGHDKRSA
ncbi:hypothetical protein [Nocardioides houyundeii]|uniref:hypothetical protein n=2 Tax=Nocardioides houyundeii TaxID=2045452 RepID=UPI000DF1C4B3|nr:hypothetical protein [Nocardioides houyundeii]